MPVSFFADTGVSVKASRNLLKNVQCRTWGKIESRYNARRSADGIAMMVLVPQSLPYSGTRKCFSTSS